MKIIKDNFVHIIMIVFLIFFIHNKNELYALYKLNSLNNCEYDISVIKKNIINDINYKNSLLNKEEIKLAINNIKFKRYRPIGYFKSMEREKMFFYHNKLMNVDFILVNDYVNNKYDISHELYHLIDYYKKTLPNVKINTNIKNSIKTPSLEQYKSFFKSWNILNFNDMEIMINDKDTIKLFEDTDENNFIDVGTILYIKLKYDEKYYLSKSELYARFNNMRLFFINKGFITYEEKLTKKKILNILNEMRKQNIGKSTEYTLTYIEYFDWFLYLPIIDYDKLEKIDFN